MERGEGERLEAAGRRKFWTLLLALAAAGAIAGFILGFATGYTEGGDHPLGKEVRLAIAAALLVSLAGAIYLSWRFFTTVDEVEVADNLWASLIGFYAYAFLFPTWWALHWLQVAPGPDDWAIFASALIAASGAYGYRKWVNR